MGCENGDDEKREEDKTESIACLSDRDELFGREQRLLQLLEEEEEEEEDDHTHVSQLEDVQAVRQS